MNTATTTPGAPTSTTAFAAYDRDGYLIKTDDYTKWTACAAASVARGTVRSYTVPVWGWVPAVPRYIGVRHAA